MDELDSDRKRLEELMEEAEQSLEEMRLLIQELTVGYEVTIAIFPSHLAKGNRLDITYKVTEVLSDGTYSVIVSEEVIVSEDGRVVSRMPEYTIIKDRQFFIDQLDMGRVNFVNPSDDSDKTLAGLRAVVKKSLSDTET